MFTKQSVTKRSYCSLSVGQVVLLMWRLEFFISLIVCRLYNKVSLIEYLLDQAKSNPLEKMSHIKGKVKLINFLFLFYI